MNLIHEPSVRVPAASTAGLDSGVRGSNHRGMRQFNERIVLQAVRVHGPIAKADLARLTQLSTQTVSIIVERLIADGLLIKQDRVRGRIGQPSVPLSLNPDGAYSLGVQVGRRSMEVLVADFAGQVRHQRVFHFELPDPDDIFPRIESSLAALRAEMGERWDRVVGLGLTAPLMLHQWADLMGPHAAPAFAKWESVDLPQRVQAMTELPVVFAKDTIAACTAEFLQGHGQRERNFLYVFVGTFIGGGLVLGGQLFPGVRGNAGAIGSFPMALSGGGRAQQLLELASGWQLEQALMAQGLDPALVGRDEVMSAAYAPLTRPWIASAGDALAKTLMSAGALLDLDAMVLDGSLSRRLLEALLAEVRERLDSYSLVGIESPTRLLMGEVGSLARAIGGALLPLHTQFFPGKDIFLKQGMD